MEARKMKMAKLLIQVPEPVTASGYIRALLERELKASALTQQKGK